MAVIRRVEELVRDGSEEAVYDHVHELLVNALDMSSWRTTLMSVFGCRRGHTYF